MHAAAVVLQYMLPNVTAVIIVRSLDSAGHNAEPEKTRINQLWRRRGRIGGSASHTHVHRLVLCRTRVAPAAPERPRTATAAAK